MNNIRDYRDLEVWKNGISLVTEIYRICEFLPKEETYGLSGQMKRAAVSIPANIAEGQGRSGLKDFVHFLSISLGSVYELSTELVICNRIGYLSENQTSIASDMCETLSKMISRLIKVLVSKSADDSQ